MKLTDATAIQVGAANASAVYLGSTKLWPVAAASAGPVLVQQATAASVGNSTSLTTTFANPPTFGNTLLLIVRRDTTSDAVTLPSGWGPAFASVPPSGSSRPISYYKKTADGTEDSTVAGFSASGQHGMAMQEWEGNVTFGTPSGVYIASPTNPQTCGPTSAPPSATAVPSMFLFAVQTSANNKYWPAGWSGTNTNNISYANATDVGIMPVAPDAAVSPSISWDSTPAGFVYWMNLWVDKP